ncbi:MAG: AarF/ABC1/UbiB kinase family protein, partial [Deltaproteobacteria bacterium]|nr:AarF/ABC1/UbiB kinase family protein [Deltaproteobacteria bacterium]
MKVLVKHGLGDVAGRLLSKKDRKGEAAKGIPAAILSPRRFRLVLEDLGPSFIKLGQLLSTRADVLPPEYIEELRRLQDRVPPAPFDEFKATIEKELKRPIDELFSEFDRDCFAAASVAQVYHATLPTGEQVVVKVIR